MVASNTDLVKSLYNYLWNKNSNLYLEQNIGRQI